MQIIFNIDDAVKNRVIEAICYNHRYQPFLEDKDGSFTLPNPETKPVFAKRMIQQFIKGNVKSYEANKNSETARIAAVSKVDNEINIT